MNKGLPQQSEEVDLGQLFKLIGNTFDRFFKFIGRIFNKLFLAFVWFVFFIKKHVLKLIIAGVIGFSFGAIIEKASGPIYKSYITVKQNYDTGEDLYNSISYYNDLVKQNDTVTLGFVLGISGNEAGSILAFEIESVITENEKIKEFDKYIKTLDTTIAKTVKYKSYIENSKDFNHQYQQIDIKSKERNNFSTVFDKLIEGISSNEYFRREQEKDLLELSNEELTLKTALLKSDSLQNTYKRVLEKSLKNKKSSEIGIIFEGANDKDQTKEFDLYINDIELRRELVEISRLKSDKKHIIEIISSKQDSGAIDDEKEVLGLLINSKVFYAIVLIILTFLTLLGLSFIKFLDKFKDKL